MPFILEAGISSSSRIAEFWGLAVAKPKPVRIVPPVEQPVEQPAVAAVEQTALPQIEAALGMAEEPPRRNRIEDLIRRALKAAGLIKKM